MDKQGEAEHTEPQAKRRWLKPLSHRLFAIETSQAKQLKKERGEREGRRQKEEENLAQK